MSNKRNIPYEQKVIEALKGLPNPLEDKRHNLLIVLEDNKIRSNETRFEHISLERHEITPNDIKRIPKVLKKCIFKIDKERKNTYSIYLRRNNYSGEYIKISIYINPQDPHKGFVKTIFITKTVK